MFSNILWNSNGALKMFSKIYVVSPKASIFSGIVSIVIVFWVLFKKNYS